MEVDVVTVEFGKEIVGWKGKKRKKEKDLVYGYNVALQCLKVYKGLGTSVIPRYVCIYDMPAGCSVRSFLLQMMRS